VLGRDLLHALHAQAHRALDDHIGGVADLLRALREWGAFGKIRLCAEGGMDQLKGVTIPLFNGLEGLDGFSDDLGPDPVAFQYGNRLMHASTDP